MGKALEVGFKVRPDGPRGRAFYRVVIHSDHRSMHAAHREERRADGVLPGAYRKPNYEAMASFSDYRVGKPGRRKKAPLRGYIRFHIGSCTGGIVSHEMTHAALYYLWYDKKLKPTPARRSADERYAYTVGEMVRQFWVNFYRLKKRGYIRRRRAHAK